MVWDPSAPPDLIDALWRDPDGLVGSGAMLKDGDRSTVVKVDHAAGPLVLKRYNPRGPMHTLVHLAMRSRARWSWLNGRRLVELGIHTPRPMACVEERLGPLRCRSFLLTTFIQGRSLHDCVTDSASRPDDLDRLATAFGDLWSDLISHRLTCGDLKASNLIVDAHQQLWLLDLDGMRKHRSGLLLRRERRRDRDSFMRNWAELPIAADTFIRRLDEISAPIGVR